MLTKNEFDSLIKMINKKTTIKSLLKILEKDFTVEATPENYIHKPRKTEAAEDATHEFELKNKVRVSTEGRASKIDHMRGAPSVSK